jgi:hypothetical protein
VTYDADEAQEWFEVLPAALGVEGLVLKSTAARYAGGRRSSWGKVKHRDTREVIIGGVLGPITRPDVVIAGRRASLCHLFGGKPRAGSCDKGQ